MSSRRPVVGIIFLVGLGIATAGAGYYTFFLPERTACPATPRSYTVNATAYQWGFIINNTDATRNGWSICRGSTVTFLVTASFDHNGDIGASWDEHGFFIDGPMSSRVIVDSTMVAQITVTFDTPGTYVLRCTEFCGESGGLGLGGHGTMRATITVT